MESSDSEDDAPRRKRPAKGKGKAPVTASDDDDDDDVVAVSSKKAAVDIDDNDAGVDAGRESLAAFKMGAKPAAGTSTSRPAAAPTGKSKSSHSHLTKAERRVIENKEKKAANEIAYSFLRDLRDVSGLLRYAYCLQQLM